MKGFNSNKKSERNAKKKKKLAALANIVQINDQERLDKAEQSKQNDDQKDDQKDDDGFIKVTCKKKSTKTADCNENTSENGPHRKRAKVFTTDGEECSDIDAGMTKNEELQAMLTLTEDQYKELKRQLRDRKRQLEAISTIKLRDFGNKALIIQPQNLRIPIFLTDIQHLLMTALLGRKSPCSPDRWCFFEKPNKLSHSVVLLLEGCSLYHYLANENKFQQTNQIFDNLKLEMILPPCRPNMMIEEIAQVPLTNVQATKLIEEHGSLEAAIQLNKDPTLLVKTIFPIDPKVIPDCEDLHPDDKFPRTKLLLSALQLVDEGYPMPLHGELRTRAADFVMTKTKYTPVTNLSPLYGVDCEMCRTDVGINELTRISIVNEKLETVYETLVRPYNKITDYLTQYSGITAEIMVAVTKTLGEVQKEVSDLLPPDAILVGQSLQSDLNAMRMMHPYVIDTSVCYNISGVRHRKSKLQKLAFKFLKESIQENVQGHDSIEDSIATMKLVKLKLANSIEFGDEILLQRRRFEEVMRTTTTEMLKNNLFAHVAQRDKCTAIISATALDEKIKNIIENLQDTGDQSNNLKRVSLFECESNKAAVRKARQIALENALVIANLKVAPEDLHDNAADKTIQDLDKYIAKMWKSVAHNGMFVVLMGGSAECPNGLAKIAIKKNIAEVVAEAPINI